MAKIQHFRQLEAWQEAHKLVLMVYRTMREYPADERFGLVAQMRRYVLSDAHAGLTAQSDSVGRLLNGLIASTERRKGRPTTLPTP